jgi:pyruvate dehydrogenase E1 component
MQRPEGGSVYLPLSTRTVDQPRREMDVALAAAVTAGGYWAKEPAPGSDLSVIAAGTVVPEARDAALVTVLDGHPLTLSWIGAVRGHRVAPLGSEAFGQSGDLPDLYRAYGLDAEAIAAAAIRSIGERWGDTRHL